MQSHSSVEETEQKMTTGVLLLHNKEDLDWKREGGMEEEP